MKPIRAYKKATIYFRDHTEVDGFEVNVHPNFVIYFDDDGSERTCPFFYISQVVNYAEGKQNESLQSG